MGSSGIVCPISDELRTMCNQTGPEMNGELVGNHSYDGWFLYRFPEIHAACDRMSFRPLSNLRNDPEWGGGVFRAVVPL